REIATDARLPDARKGLVLALLGELGAPLPASVRLLEDREPRRGTLADLARAVAEPADAARAADELIGRTEGRGVVSVARDLVAGAGAAAVPLLDELLVRDDISPSDKQGLAALRPELDDGPAPRGPASRVWIGGDATGQVIVAARPGRVLVVHLGPD